MKHVDRVAHVERLTQRARDRGPRVQDKPVLPVPRANDCHGILEHDGRRRDVGNHPAVGAPELKLAVQLALDLIALLVDRTMVSTTEQGQVRECGGASMGPVTNVMSMAKAHAAARKATSAVPMVAANARTSTPSVS